MTGRCYCGAVRYEVTPPFKFIAHDHCSICRRISGAAFVTWAGVKETQFKLLSGEKALREYKSTEAAVRHFCATCGSHLFFRSIRWPGEVHVTVATLDEGVEPKAHVFYTDKASWIHVHDDLPKYGGKTGTDPLNSGQL
jgi:hypothetical protein